MNGRTPAAFTLIELLVVVTIIVALLAMLAPAMDQAIYQAELAVCSAQLNAVGTSTTVYAFDFKRRYPWRSAIESPQDSWMPYMLYGASAWHVGLLAKSGTVHDDRPELESYMSINKYLNCPFTPKADYLAVSLTDASSVFSDYELWFGWQYSGRPGLKKVGDRLSALENRNYTGASKPLLTHDVLASDHWFLQTDGTNLWESAHPDRQGAASQVVLQPGISPFNAVSTYWQITGAPNLNGKQFDLNFARTDGSVERVREIDAPFDDRMSYVWNEKTENGSYAILPRGR